jgi:hypothetical protein
VIYFKHLVQLTEADNTVEEGMWLPREMAVVECSLRHGIMNTYHQFIWQGMLIQSNLSLRSAAFNVVCVMQPICLCPSAAHSL